MPPPYNVIRIQEQPVPSLTLDPNEDEQDEVSQSPNSSVNTENNMENESNDSTFFEGEEDLAHGEGHVSEDDSFGDLKFSEEEEEQDLGDNIQPDDDEVDEDEESETKSTERPANKLDLGEVHTSKERAFDEATSNETAHSNIAVTTGDATDESVQNNVSSTSSVDQFETVVESIKTEPVFAELPKEDAQAIDEVLSASFEQCYDSDDDVLVSTAGIIPQPKSIKNPYEVKTNDILSGNMPFATNVSKIICLN